MYSHQDWETVVLKPSKEKHEEQTIKKTVTETLTASQKPAWKIEKQVDSEEGKPITLVSTSVAKMVTGARVAKKISQKDLARKLNVPEKDIKDIEAGKALENKALLAKIKRELGL